MTALQKRDEIGEVAEGARPIEKLFTTERPHSFAFDADATGLHAERRFTLHPAPDGATTVIVSHEIQVGPLPRPDRAFLAPRPYAANQAMFVDLARAAGDGGAARASGR